MPVAGSTSLPIGGRDANFDGGSARARIVDFYTKNGVTNWSQVKRGFFWIVPGKEELKTGYRLGFTDIVDGKLVALPRGLFAVAGGHGVQRVENISSADRNAIKRKVNTYYGRMKAKFPTDDFDFDPPFPDVKESDDVADPLDDVQEQIDKTLDAIEADLRSKFMGIGNATSFADLEAIDQVRFMMQKVFKTVHDFQMLVGSVARNSDGPEELIRRVRSLSVEMAGIFSKMSKEPMSPSENDKALTSFVNDQDPDTDWEINQRKSTALLKNKEGKLFFYGRFTNNLWDKEKEVLTTEAHKDFVDYLDSHPDKAPELWDWHEEDTAKTHKACWWDFADGFLHCIWEVTDKEAAGIEAFMKEFEPGMSHGFEVLERDQSDPRQIVRYRTFESSILPLEFAANEWTTFDLIQEAKAKAKAEGKEVTKMFTPEKERALELLSLGDYIKPLGKASEDDAVELDLAGAQRKDNVGNENPPEDNTPTMSDQENNPQVQDQPVEDADTKTTTDLESLQASIVEGFNLLTQQIGLIAKQVKANTDALHGIKEAKGQSPSVAAWVAAQKATTAIGDDNGDTDDKGGPGSGRNKRPPVDDDPLFGDAPEEAPFEIDGHLLANY